MENYTLGLFSNAYPSDDSDWRGIFVRRMVEDLEARGVKVIRAVKTTPSMLGYIPFLLQSVKISTSERSEILQAEYIPHSSIIPAVLKRGKPLVLKFHGDDARIFPFKSMFHRSLTRYMIRRADHIVTSSEEIKRILIDLGASPQRVSAIHTGVDTDYFVPMDRLKCRKDLGLPGKSCIFLFIGRLHPWKGIFELLEAATLLPHYTFIFVGPGNIPNHPENCSFIGPVPPDQIRVWINAADCVVLPTYTEAIPTSILESSACGVPAIASNIGGCPEIVEDNVTGILIPVKNVKELSMALRWMAEHPAERIEMGRKARIKVEEYYDSAKMITRLISLHRRLIGRNENSILNS